MSSSFDEFRARLDDEAMFSVVSWHIERMDGVVSLRITRPDFGRDSPVDRLARLHLRDVDAAQILRRASFSVEKCMLATDHVRLWSYGPSAEVRCAAAVPQPLQFALALSEWLGHVGAP